MDLKLPILFLQNNSLASPKFQMTIQASPIFHFTKDAYLKFQLLELSPTH